MGIRNIQAEAFGEWLEENHSLHDAILFGFEFLNGQNDGDAPFPVNVLKLGLKIPVDLALGKYDTVSVVLRGVISVDVKIRYLIDAQCFLDAIYLTNAEIEVDGISGVGKTKVFRLKLYGDYYSEREREWNERQIVDVSCESFENHRQD